MCVCVCVCLAYCNRKLAGSCFCGYSYWRCPRICSLKIFAQLCSVLSAVWMTTVTTARQSFMFAWLALLIRFERNVWCGIDLKDKRLILMILSVHVEVEVWQLSELLCPCHFSLLKGKVQCAIPYWHGEWPLSRETPSFFPSTSDKVWCGIDHKDNRLILMILSACCSIGWIST